MSSQSTTRDYMLSLISAGVDCGDARNIAPVVVLLYWGLAVGLPLLYRTEDLRVCTAELLEKGVLENGAHLGGGFYASRCRSLRVMHCLSPCTVF